MRNCLVTQLKGDTQNDNLPIFGELVLQAKKITIPDGKVLQGENVMLQFNQTDYLTVSVDGDGYFATSFDGLDDPSQRMTSFTYNPGTETSITTLFFKNDNYNVHFSNKYAIHLIWTYCDRSNNKHPETLLDMDLAKLEYMTSLKRLILNYSGAKTHGNILSLASCPNIVDFMMANCPRIEGNITSIANKLKLSSLFIYLTAITGSIEDVVTGQIEQGVVTGTISARGLASQLTFGGSIQTSDYDSGAVLYWNTASKIYFGLGNSANINSCTTIYAKGATAEEISAWENAGKTVHVIS